MFFYKITSKLGARSRDVHVQTMKAYKGIRNINPLIHYRVFRWRPLVSLTLWPLYSERKSPLHELSRNLVGSQDQFGCLREEKNFYPCQETKLNHPAHSVFTTLTLKTADTQITFALAATLHKVKLHYLSISPVS